ncbi:selenocysteine-specific translation elongation factor [Aliibacillus thermotolerans]|uniref:Selenocysteine-specific elongation factor n=1 Tax=Aliibacillus thermotolerans TaxID=1834418 RepID=A0ABW0U5F9_9BACI|nr:selenocysteine-specific translation elongation factor [Aliibacillus thermotolerans]
MKKSYTVGMAGHIDHGKTALTKALTSVDTDRLKEEKERKITIEPGYAPLSLTEEMEVSIIDVPGHEKFIRQMIAGVAGIDAVILVVAADEGVMPQTKEHIDILTLLEVKAGFIVVTKSDLVDDDFLSLVSEDIEKEVKGTIFEGTPILFADSVTKRGIVDVKEQLIHMLHTVSERNIQGDFRLPIDHVFTVHGQGTVIRGTVFEGKVQVGETLFLLPINKKVTVRQLQKHGKRVPEGKAGERLALNISGINALDVKRGDVATTNHQLVTTHVINVVLYLAKEVRFNLEQRTAIKLHIGTAEVYGKIIFFDRNVLQVDIEKSYVLCQLRLDDPIVTKRGDRYILRRPSPVETIGGGWVIDPNGKKMRYGKETIAQLQKQFQGTPTELVEETLRRKKTLSKQSLMVETTLSQEEVNAVLKELEAKGLLLSFSTGQVALTETYQAFQQEIEERLKAFHQRYPLRLGENIEEVRKQVSIPTESAQLLLERLEKEKKIKRTKQFISLPSFQPSYPNGWEKRMEQAYDRWIKDGIQTKRWNAYGEEEGITKDIFEEWKYALLDREIAVKMDEHHLWPRKVLEEAKEKIKQQHPFEFTIQQAKEILGVSRKYLIPFLEWLDETDETKRKEDRRVWRT